MGSSTYNGKREFRSLTIAAYWGCFLVFLKVVNLISISVIFGIYHFYPKEEISGTLKFLYSFLNRTILWLTDLLTVNTLVYLFYVQSSSAQAPKDKNEIMAEALRDDMKKIINAGKDKRREYDTQDIKQLLENGIPTDRFSIQERPSFSNENSIFKKLSFNNFGDSAPKTSDAGKCQPSDASAN